MEDKSVWVVKDLKKKRLFRIDYWEEYREYLHTYVEAEDEEEARKKFSRGEYGCVEMDDSEYLESEIVCVEEED